MAEQRPFIASSSPSLYLLISMLRLLTACFIALAMFLSPVLMATRGGAAMAHATVVEDGSGHGHCEGKGAPADDNKKSEMKFSCASTCAAFLAVVPVVAGQGGQPKPVIAEATLSALSGVPPERETPPPRTAPAI